MESPLNNHICSFYPSPSLSSSPSFLSLLKILGPEAVQILRTSLKRTIVLDVFVVAVYNRGFMRFSDMMRWFAVGAGELKRNDKRRLLEEISY